MSPRAIAWGRVDRPCGEPGSGSGDNRDADLGDKQAGIGGFNPDYIEAYNAKCLGRVGEILTTELWGHMSRISILSLIAIMPSEKTKFYHKKGASQYMKRAIS